MGWLVKRLQSCRFHVVYPKRDWADDEFIYEFEAFTEEEWDDYEMYLCEEIEEGDRKMNNVELRKAQDILHGDHRRSFCRDCEPICTMLGDSMHICMCDLYSNFVERWRCIPCVLAEQTKSVLQRQHYKTTYKPQYENRPDMRVCLYWQVSDHFRSHRPQHDC